MVWRLIAISLTLLCFIPGLCAQDFEAGINFLLGQPKGEFKENVEDLGFGIGGMFKRTDVIREMARMNKY